MFNYKAYKKEKRDRVYSEVRWCVESALENAGYDGLELRLLRSEVTNYGAGFDYNEMLSTEDKNTVIMKAIRDINKTNPVETSQGPSKIYFSKRRNSEGHLVPRCVRFWNLKKSQSM